ncbi:helix-turn-helix transcriptional regulator [Jatrophihabitans sp.]|uniref:helix-turn-helix transcriptional regulator n=1 Tax=Jatrophihabitans sp. TaxID=1932789 RepID=UPI002C127AA2|nr:helix-turn-helix transcriptional regulator [Jatrophihabitans sp.]
MITNMWDRYDEPLSLEEMADMAVFSRFYFSRFFRSITGTSPGRFLTAIRLYKAKNLLLETSMSVTDISYQVGYNSPGTFSSRFTRSVGISPARYRYLSEVGIPAPDYPVPTGHPLGAVHGSVTMPELKEPARIYVSLFDSTIPQGTPVVCVTLDGAGNYELPAVPEGQWYLYATAVAVQNLDPRPWVRKPLLVSASRPVKVVAGRTATAHVELRPPRLTDLPILLALPELDSREPVPTAAPRSRNKSDFQRPSTVGAAGSERNWAGDARLVVT